MLPLAPLLLVSAAAGVAGPHCLTAVARPGEVVVLDFTGPGFPGRCDVRLEVHVEPNRGLGGYSSSSAQPAYDPLSFGERAVELMRDVGCLVRPTAEPGRYYVVRRTDEKGNTARVVNVAVSSRNLPPGVGPRVYKVKLPD